MLKKTFSMLFVCMIMAATNAYATPNPCYKKNATISGLTSGQSIKADYAVYFDTNHPTASEGTGLDAGCENDVQQNVINEINGNAASIDQVLILGMADSQGSGNKQLNAGLGNRRMQTIKEMLAPSLQTCDASTEHCAQLSMGDAPSIVERLTSANSDERRAAFIWVLYKQAKCTQTIIDALSNLNDQIDARSDAKTNQDIINLKALIANAQEICNDDSLNSYILSEDNETIHKVWLAASQIQGITVQGGLAVRALVDSVKNTMTALNLKTSVWRTEKGGFNYSRLISDSIAGVVLGTASGLITSHIVKKNQLKSGFENVMCTIAGQSVASYGDEFTVGIQQQR